MLPIGIGTLDAFTRRRQCPKCKRIQVVPVSQREKTVSCKYCAAKIPPKKKTR